MKNKQLARNQYTHDLIMSRINAITGVRFHSEFSDLKEELAAMSDNLRLESITDSKATFVHDAKILCYLNAIQSDIASQSFKVAMIRFEKLKKLMIERNQVANDAGLGAFTSPKERRLQARTDKKIEKLQRKKGGKDIALAFKTEELYADDDLYELKVAGLEDARRIKYEEGLKYLERYQKNPNDVGTFTKLKTLEQELMKLDAMIQMHSNEMIKNSFLDRLKSLPETQKRIASARTYTNESAQVIMDEYNQMVQEQGSDIVMGAYMQSQQQQGSIFGIGAAPGMGMGMNVGMTSGMGMGMNAGMAPGMGMGMNTGMAPGMGINAGMGAPSIFSVPNPNASAAQNNAKHELENLKKVVNQLEQQENRFNDEIQSLGIEQARVIAELKPMLADWDRMTPMQRKVYKGQIDSKKGELNRITQKIDRINQARAATTDQLNLATMKQQIDELDRMCNGSVAANVDFMQMSEYIKKATEQGNSKLDALATAVAVSQSTEVRTDSMTGSMQSESSSTEGYGDTEYDDLKRQIGYKA